MKARLFTLILALSCLVAFSGSASERVSASDTDMLSDKQKYNIRYAKKLLSAYSNEIALPLEINAMIGDTVTCEPYMAAPQWDNAYFVDDERYESSLVIPLQAATPYGIVKSALNVLIDGKQHYRTVKTTLKGEAGDNGTPSTIISVMSNVDGFFLNAKVSQNGAVVEEIAGLVGDAGVLDDRSKKRVIGLGLPLDHYEKKMERKLDYIQWLKEKHNVDRTNLFRRIRKGGH